MSGEGQACFFGPSPGLLGTFPGKNGAEVALRQKMWGRSMRRMGKVDGANGDGRRVIWGRSVFLAGTFTIGKVAEVDRRQNGWGRSSLFFRTFPKFAGDRPREERRRGRSEAEDVGKVDAENWDG